ncbi:MAG: asparagine synthase (glutamine-hydrolyzing) [Alphaproteobacteria bacterium]|nr:asparagine synthase (glutamine-hydrolyzing) [Alphaproteobacteria bacterium]
MCGITGAIFLSNRSKEERVDILSRMNNAIAHRGPDSEGTWHDDTRPVALAQRRLAIIDLSPAGYQPMESASGRYMLSFNGEFYTHNDVREVLAAKGHKFRGTSDTETILASVEEWGVDAGLGKIRGMFALILWDKQEEAVHIWRDHFGKKPLYVGWAGNDVFFSSELKSFHTHPNFHPALNQHALSLYLKFACVPAPFCIFENVWMVPPAHRATLKLANLKPKQDLSALFNPHWSANEASLHGAQNKLQLSETEAIDALETLLRQCVKDRFISDVPLGAFLSGGIDSSTVVALMQKESAQKVRTYTIGFEEKNYNEAEFAKEVAQHLGTEHHEQYMTDADALAVVPKLPTMFDEPFADPSQIPTHLVSAFARKHVTVALSGDGGDEMAGGYRRHWLVPKLWNMLKFIPHPLRAAAAKMLESPALFPALSGLAGGDSLKTERYLKGVTLLDLKTEQDVFWYLMGYINNANDFLKTPDTTWDSLKNTFPTRTNFQEEMLIRDTLFYLPHDILTKVDRASMAVALECRAPFLDTRIFEFMTRLPLSYKLRGDSGKWIIKQVLKRHVPEEMFERPKRGFSPPITHWLRGGLKDWAGDLLSTETILAQGYLDNSKVQTLWQRHRDGTANYPNELWVILMFQAWLERWKN